MSDNYQFYSTYNADAHPEPVSAPDLQSRIIDGALRVSASDGVMTETPLLNDSGHSGQLNPHFGESGALATAQNPNGMPVTEILPTTLITIDGLQAAAEFWCKEGRLAKAADGTYSESSAQAPAIEAPGEDFQPLPDRDMTDIATALEGVDAGNIDALLGMGVGVAVGRLDDAALLAKFQQVSGRDDGDAQARLAMIRGKFEQQASKALQASGLTATDVPLFLEWARTQQQGRLQEAISNHVHGASVAGYRALADRWMSETPPSIEALKAGGVPVRAHATGNEIWVRGSWMSPSAAARAGLI